MFIIEDTKRVLHLKQKKEPNKLRAYQIRRLIKFYTNNMLYIKDILETLMATKTNPNINLCIVRLSSLVMLGNFNP